MTQPSEINTTVEPILVVDDDTLVLNTIVEILNHHGSQATGAQSVKEALPLLQNNQYSLVVSDVRMPETDGISFCEFLCQHFPETKVIILTAHANIEDAVKVTKMGCYDYLVKPISVASLVAKVQGALKARKEEELNPPVSKSAQPVKDLEKSLAEPEKMIILQALREHKGNVVETARALNVSRTTLYNKFKKHNISIENLRFS